MIEPTPLEEKLLYIFHDLYCDLGFPSADKISVRDRNNTGGGRYVNLKFEEGLHLDVEEGHVRLDLGGRYIEMEGLPYGMMALIHVEDRRPTMLEIVVYGDDYWSGEERHWSIC